MTRTSKLDSFHLHIADFCIELNFSKIDELKIKKPLIQNIYYYYTPYLSGSCLNKSHYTIKFLETRDIPLLGKKNGNQMDYFVQLFSKEKTTLYVQFHVSIDQLQLIFKIIVQELLLKSGGLYLHASSILNNNRVHVFTGPSTIGKSTIVKKLSKDFIPFTDDVIILKPNNDLWVGYQMPLEAEKNAFPFSTSQGFPIELVALLNKAKRYRMTRIGSHRAIDRLMQQISGGTVYKNHLSSLFQFANITPIYEAHIPLNLTGEKYRDFLNKLRAASTTT